MKLKRLLAVSAISSGLLLSACTSTPAGSDNSVTTASLLQGGEWIVEDLAGKGIIDSSHISIIFMDENRVGGSSSCNRYSGEYTLEGSKFSVGDNLASTRMACAPALMNQEDVFLKLLLNVDQARFGDNGELLLTTPEGDAIRAFPATSGQ